MRLSAQRTINKLKAALVARPHASDLAESRELVIGYLQAGYDKFSIGGGRKNLEGFVNVDFVKYPGVNRQIVADASNLSFFPSSCASQIHSNHVLEHFPEDQLKNQLHEYRRILRPGGTLSVRCPNALGVALGFWFPPVLEEGREEFLRLGFPSEEDFSNPADTWLHKDVFGLLHWFYGSVGSPGNEHLTLLTPTRLKGYFIQAGFSLVAMTAPEAINMVAICRKQ